VTALGYLMVLIESPVAMLVICTELSNDPEACSFPSGEKLTEETSLKSWMYLIVSPVSILVIFTELSHNPKNSSFPSSEMLTDKTSLECKF